MTPSTTHPTISPSQEATVRKIFHYGNYGMVALWRLGLGKFINATPDYTGRIMVLRHVGRKSGQPHYTPVNYFQSQDDVYCVAGFGHTADWYRNALAQPHVEVWLPNGAWQGVAEAVTDPAVRLKMMRAVLIASGFAAPLFGIHPKRLTDDELQAQTADYPLMGIHLTQPRTGQGGPGEWAWVWWLVGAFLLWRWLQPRKEIKR